MRILVTVSFLLAIVSSFFAGAVVGKLAEADRIQSTCESEDVKTVINGQTYLCLTRAQLLQLIKSAKEKQA